MADGERMSRREAFVQSKATDQPAPATNGACITDAPYDLTPDIKTGYYTICIKKPNPDYSNEEAETTFKQFGPVGRMNFTKMFVFVMYIDKNSAIKAMETLSEEFEIFVPKPRTEESIKSRTDKYIREQATKPEEGQGDGPPELEASPNGKQPDVVDSLMSKFSSISVSPAAQTRPNTNWQDHIRNNPCVYIGNIPKDMEKAELETLMKDYGYNEMMFYIKGIKRFAFVYFPNMILCQKVQKDFSGMEVHKNKLFVNFVRDKSRARIMEGRDSRPGAPRVPSLMNQDTGPHSHQRGSGPNPHATVMVPMSQLQGATDLVYRIDGLLGEILDSCYFCQRVGGLVKELQHCMGELTHNGQSNQHAMGHNRGTPSPRGGAGRGMQGVNRGGYSGGQAGQAVPGAGDGGITLGRGRAGASY